MQSDPLRQITRHVEEFTAWSPRGTIFCLSLAAVWRSKSFNSSDFQKSSSISWTFGVIFSGDKQSPRFMMLCVSALLSIPNIKQLYFYGLAHKQKL